jgi:hypothetical protein
MNVRRNIARRYDARICPRSVIALLYLLHSTLGGEEIKMKIRNLVTGTAIALTAAVFVLGSAVSSEAKGKKKAEAAPQRSATCIFSAGAPVCASRGGQSFTYRNACYAGNDGAVVKASKACAPAKAMKGKKGGKKAMKKAGKKKK